MKTHAQYCRSVTSGVEAIGKLAWPSESHGYQNSTVTIKRSAVVARLCAVKQLATSGTKNQSELHSAPV